MSPLTPYSPGLPILQTRGWSRGQRGWEGAADVNLKVQQGLRWSCGRHSDRFPPPPLTHDGQSSSPANVFESGALVLSVWLPGVMGKPLCLVVTLEVLSASKACCCDSGTDLCDTRECFLLLCLFNTIAFSWNSWKYIYLYNI